MTCGVCDIRFRGRSDAVYCSPACRQKAHRSRTARRIADLVDPWGRPPGIGQPVMRREIVETVRRARDEQRRARKLCRDAAAAQRRSLAAQRLTTARRLTRTDSADTSNAEA